MYLFSGQNSQNPIKGRPIVHITRAAYSDSLESCPPAPALVADDISPETPASLTAAVAPFESKYWKGGISSAILDSAATSKEKADCAKFSLKSALSESSIGMAKFVIDNALIVSVSVENGFADGPARSLWFKWSWRFPWVVRMLRYLILGRQCGFWIFASRQGPSFLNGCLRRLRGVTLALPTDVSTLPVSKGGRPSVVSESLRTQGAINVYHIWSV